MPAFLPVGFTVVSLSSDHFLRLYVSLFYNKLDFVRSNPKYLKFIETSGDCKEGMTAVQGDFITPTEFTGSNAACTISLNRTEYCLY